MRQTRRQNYHYLTQTKMYRSLLRRYHRLVNKQFSEGLTEREQTKMDSLGRRADRYHDCFYAPILERLEAGE